MQLITTSFDFYKRFLLVSFLLNLLMLSLGFEVAVILFFKFFAAVLLWGWYRTEGKKQLIFYHNLGWSTVPLLAIGLGYDLLIFVPVAVIFRYLG